MNSTVQASRRRFLGLFGGSQPDTPVMRAVTGDTCLSMMGVTCEICRDACDAGAITLMHSPGMPARPVVSAACTGCNACVPACPANAITLSAGSQP